MTYPNRETVLLHELIHHAALLAPDAPALDDGGCKLTYHQLQAHVDACANGLIGVGLARGDRVGIWLEKRLETVVASFGAPAAGGVMVPMNPLLKPEQVLYIARDCNVRVLITSPDRLALLAPLLAEAATAAPDLVHMVLIAPSALPIPLPPHMALHTWQAMLEASAAAGHRVIDTDTTAILYTSGSPADPRAWC